MFFKVVLEIFFNPIINKISIRIIILFFKTMCRFWFWKYEMDVGISYEIMITMAVVIIIIKTITLILLIWDEL